MATAHATAMTSTTATIVTASDLLPVRWDHCGLVTAHRVVTHGSSVVISTVEVSTATTTASTGWEGRSATRAATAASFAAAATTTLLVVTLILGFGFLNIHTPAVDLSNWVVLNKILGDGLVGEGNEAETARRTGVDVLKDDGIVNLAKLHEVLLQLLAR